MSFVTDRLANMVGLKWMAQTSMVVILSLRLDNPTEPAMAKNSTVIYHALVKGIYMTNVR